MCYGRFISGFVWAMALFTTAEWKGCYGCWEQERISLLHLKYSLNNPPYMSSWSGERTNSSDDECCYWDGVSCNPATGKVAELDLGYQDESDFNSPAKPDLNASLFLPFQDLTLLSLRGYHIQGWPSFGSLEILAIWSSTMDDNFLDAVGITMMGLASLEIWNSPLGSGTFPQVCNLTRLQNLYLLEMNLTGELPQCLSNMTSLRVIDVAGNELSGDIAESPLTAISSLEQIMIPKNRFRIPLSLAPFFNHSRLKTFFGAGNKELYGDKNDHYETNQRDTPPLFLLNYLTLSSGSDDHHDGYFGSFPKFLYYQTNLQGVYLSRNKLGGSLSGGSDNHGISSVKKEYTNYDLQVLDLGHNRFTGPIPPTFSGLISIETLDISHNNLSGVIPTQLMELNYLSSFSVAYNNLSGKCPKRVGQLSTFDEDSYRGNPHLMNCTLLQSTPKPYVTQTPTDDNDGEYGGYIDMESFYTSSGVSFVLVLLTIASVLYINPYWRQVWFYYVRVTITTCYYFVVDHLPVSTRYKVWEPHV
ncbi:unnamed protein product [Linum trigynum]|uniref:Leucine-rich repeat-containing N-terminal plant-type domain-containing protein n=1 Tax=Linum trigynum TaxID=586398 RepID=A0AAV2CRQ2_9ROSI